MRCFNIFVFFFFPAVNDRLEIAARIVVSGLVINPTHESNITRPLAPDDMQSNQSSGWSSKPSHISHSVETHNIYETAFLRHSFNRIDLVAVASYWIDLVLTIMNVRGFYLFKALAALRSLRLLAITSGSATILESLKKSAPLLVNVLFFVGLFFVLFSIIGVQSFKGSFLRHCVYDGSDPPLPLNPPQFCGGYLVNISGNLKTMPFKLRNGGISKSGPKGYTCPLGQICQVSTLTARVKGVKTCCFFLDEIRAHFVGPIREGGSAIS
jgi:hypothetical protein